MLVLSATYYNQWLRTLVPTERFEYLLKRTISFLRPLAFNSPTCAIDCQILERIDGLIFGIPPDEKHVYRNEGIEQPASATTSFGPNT